MTFTVFACETVTGRNLGPIDLDIQSWTRVLNGSETAEFRFNADAAAGGLSAATRDWYRLVTAPGRATLVVDWDGIPIWAGPVTSRQRSDTDGTVTVSASGILWVLTRRKLADPNNSSVPPDQQVYTWVGDYGYIAQQLLAFTLARGALPIVLPGLSAGTANTVTYNGADLNTISDLLTALTGLDNGPDIDFRPFWVDANRSAVNWQMIAGTAAAPRISSINQITWDPSSVAGGVRGVQAVDDASNMVTTQWAKGTSNLGPELMSAAQSSQYTGLGWPLLEGETDYTAVNDQATLDTHTATDLANYTDPTDQWQVTVDALSDPRLGSYQLGDLPTVRFQGDFWIPDGIYPMRILQIAGDNSTAVKVTVQGADAAGLDIIGAPDDSLPARLRRLERRL